MPPASAQLVAAPRVRHRAREGSSEKWLQKVAGYYFARARLQTARFAGEPAVAFTFYYDPAEPIVGESPRRRGDPNVNPEVVCCRFID